MATGLKIISAPFLTADLESVLEIVKSKQINIEKVREKHRVLSEKQGKLQASKERIKGMA